MHAHDDTRPRLTDEQARIRTLENELVVLRSRHETLGGAYRTACEELTLLRKETENYRARLHAVRILCEATAP